MKHWRDFNQNLYKCFQCSCHEPKFFKITWSNVKITERRPYKITNIVNTLAPGPLKEFDALELRWYNSLLLHIYLQNKLGLGRLDKQCQSSADPYSSSIPQYPPDKVPCKEWPGLCVRFVKKKAKETLIGWKLEKSAELIHRSRLHPVMSTRLTRDTGLIVAGGCYHLLCLLSFERQSAKSGSAKESQQPVEDECMTKLCRDLCVGLSVRVTTDVLEATVDGKNTFHCTQMMVWQDDGVAKSSIPRTQRTYCKW